MCETLPAVVAKPNSCAARSRSPRRAPPCTRPPGVRINPNAAHASQIDQQPALWHGVAQDAVASAPDTDLKVVLSGESDGGRHIRVAGAARHDRRATIRHRIPHPASRVVAVIARQHDLTIQSATKAAHVVAGITDHLLSPPFSSLRTVIQTRSGSQTHRVKPRAWRRLPAFLADSRRLSRHQPDSRPPRGRTTKAAASLTTEEMGPWV